MHTECQKTFSRADIWKLKKHEDGKFKNIRSSGFVVAKRMELTQHCECGINGGDIWILSSQFITQSPQMCYHQQSHFLT